MIAHWIKYMRACSANNRRNRRFYYVEIFTSRTYYVSLKKKVKSNPTKPMYTPSLHRKVALKAKKTQVSMTYFGEK